MSQNQTQELLQQSLSFLKDLMLEWTAGNSYCRPSEEDVSNLQFLIDKIEKME